MDRFFVIVFLFGLFILNQQTLAEETVLKKMEVSDILVDDFTNSFAPKQISKQRLESSQTQDVLRALKETPGVYSREEDGLGLRPNIGLRGTNPDRSKKVVLLEDEILIGPAPYSAPAAYYTPSMISTESLEVYKGFSALIYGPNSVGGAVNYKTKSMQSRDFQKIKLSLGSFESGLLNADIQKRLGEVNVLFQGAHSQSNGFKKIDNGRENKLEQNIFGLKMQYPFQMDSWAHVLELKLGYSNEKSDETYLGLTEDDFWNSPYRRYNASELDQMKWTHQKIQLEHWMDNSEGLTIKNQLYSHRFNRTWYRLDSFRDSTKTILSVVRDPTGTQELFYNVLTGQSNSADVGASADLNIAGNERHYLSQGFQSIWEKKTDITENVLSQTKMKFLLHQDSIQRDHTANYYSMTDGQMIRTQDAVLNTTLNQDSAQAASIAVHQQFGYKKYQFLLQARYENVEFQFQDDLNKTKNSRSDQVFIPGAGLNIAFMENLGLRISGNQAATLSGLDSTGKEKREESFNFETGLQWQSPNDYQQFEILYFKNDYKNLTGTCTSSTGCANNQLDQQFNGGAAEIEGFEARIAQGFSWNQFWFPIQINTTVLNTRFKNSFNSTSQEWGIGQVQEGDPLPYVPRYLVTALIGVEYKKIKNNLAIHYQGLAYDQSVNINRIEIPAYGLIDYSLGYQLNSQTEVFAKVDNILNKRYLVSAKPFGYRPGKPQTIAAGFQMTF